MDITKMQVAGWECRYYGMEHTELERRREAVRQLMREKNLRVLMLVDMVRGGFFQWFLGAGISERPTEEILIFPLEGKMTICLTSACFTDEEQQGYKKVNAVNSQDARFGDAVNVPAFYYRYLKDAFADEQTGGENRIGIVYPDSLRKTVKDYLYQNIPEISLVDVTEELEELKAAKSDAERKVLKDMADFHDRLFSFVPCAAIPGRLEGDVAKELRYRAYEMGCGGEDVTRNAVLYLTSGRDGEQEEAGEVEYPGKALREGDRLNLKMQCVAYDDFYGALGRCFVLGEASEATKKDWQALTEIQDYMASLLKPGATVKNIAEKTNLFRRERNIPEDRTNFLYGIGHRAGEAPNLTAFPEMPLREGMVLVLSPVLKREGQEAMYCADMYEVGKEHGVRLNRFPREIKEIFIQ